MQSAGRQPAVLFPARWRGGAALFVVLLLGCTSESSSPAPGMQLNQPFMKRSFATLQEKGGPEGYYLCDPWRARGRVVLVPTARKSA